MTIGVAPNITAGSRNAFDGDRLAARMARELTVIVPAYRCGRYLPAAVASVMDSPVRAVLIAEDASGDETLASAYGCRSRYPNRISVVRNDRRRGPGANVNAAVRQVATPFFAKLDGDDVLIPGFLRQAFGVIAGNPEIAVVAGRDLRIEAGEALEYRKELLPAVRSAPPVQLMKGGAALKFILKWNPNPCSSGAIYRTEAFHSVGGFDEQISWGEDWEIWLRFAETWSVAYCDAVSALYRQHPGSITARHVRENRLCYGYDAVFQSAARIGRHDPDVQPALRNCFLRVAKWYCGSAIRQFRDDKTGSLRSVAQAFRALARAGAI